MAPARFIPILLLLLAAPAAGNPIVEAAIGWGGRYRPDRWTTAYVIVQAPQPTPAIFEWYIPRPGLEAMVIRQQATLNPTSRTVFSYLPIGPDPVAIHLRISDARTGRTLGHWPPEPRSPEAWVEAQVREPFFIGVSGSGPALRFLPEETYGIAFLHPELLPRQAVGFDGLDLLALNRPQLARMDLGQQEAILAWVRAGGRVLLWLDAQAIPTDAPLAELLPGPVQEFTTIQFGPKPVPFTRIRGIGEEQLVSRRPLGLGQVIFLHVPPQAAAQAGADFLPETPIVHLLSPPELDPATFDAVARAARAPGWGGFVLLLGIALLIGPVDWFVMRQARRRSRPWITLAGWVGVFAVLIWYLPAADPAQHVVNVAPLAVGDTTLAASASAATSGGTGFREAEGVPMLEEIGDVYWSTLGYNRTRGPIRDLIFHQGNDGMRPGGIGEQSPAFVGHGIVFRD